MNIYKSMSHVSQGTATKFPLYLTHIADQPEMEAHSHEFVELVLILHGKAHYRQSGSEAVLKRGDVLLVPRGDLHSYRGCEKLDLLNILYIPDMLPMPQLDAAGMTGFELFYQGRMEENHPVPLLRLEEARFAPLEAPALELAEECRLRRPGFQFHMLGLFMVLLGKLARMESSGMVVRKKDRNELPEVIAYLHRNFRRRITLEQLCRVGNVSRSSLMRNFARTVGTTPLRYQLELRISEAIQLLTMTGKSPGEIAFEVGFSDGNYFSRQFKKITGSSPQKYRKEYRTGQSA